MVSAYPLQWPPGWPREPGPRRSIFDTPFAKARDGLLRELRLLGATNPVISSNVRLRRDGLPYANQPEPGDSGVAVYFELDGEQMCIPCDRWDLVRDNIQAIRKSVEALRGLERWGAKEMVSAAFTGFRALPGDETREELTGQGMSSEENPYVGLDKRELRRLLKLYHPDTGEGNTERFRLVKEAMDKKSEG